MVKIERELQIMHRDFRKIMDTINDTNAGENIKKYSKLLTEIEKVSALQVDLIGDPQRSFLGLQNAE